MMTIPSHSSDQELLKQLAEVARAEQMGLAGDSLAALVRGVLGPTERARLLERAKNDSALARSLQVHWPLDESAQVRLTEAVLAAFPSAATDPGRGSPARLRWRRVAAFTVPVVAAAAAFLIFLGIPPSAPLPNYSLRLSGSEVSMRSSESSRGSATEALVLGPQTVLTAWLRPQTAVAGDLVVRSFFVQEGRAQPWPAKVETAPSGAVRLWLHAPLARWSGDAQLAIWLGRSASSNAPLDELEKQAEASASSRSWKQAISVR